MFKASSKKNKKSAIEVSLIHLLEIVLAIAMAIILIYFSLKLSGLFIGRQEYDSTINNLEALAVRIIELANDKKDSLTQTTVYSITDDYILVGFSYNDNSIKTECTGENIAMSRPKLCQSKSCLCIYQNFNGNDFDSRGGVFPIKCKPFDEKIIFFGPASNSNFKGITYQSKSSSSKSTGTNYLVLYGICGGPWRTSLGVKQVYLEKYKDGENIFITMNEVGSNFKPSGGGTGGAGAQGNI